MKKIVTILSIIIVLSILFFLHKNKNDNNELVFWTLQLGTFDKYINSIITEFENTNPNVKIKWVDVPYSEGEKRTLAALLSDNPPDLINLTPDFSVMAAQKNALYEIPKEVMNVYPESLHKSLSFNRKFYAIPFYLTSAITFANSDLMNELNISKIPKTYDEMFSTAQIAKKSGYYIEMPAVTENDTFIKILNKYNVDIYKNINTDTSASVFKMYEELYRNNLIPKESLTQGHRDALEKYMAGQIVFLQAGANFLNIIKENAPLVYKNTILSKQLTGSSGLYDFSLMNLIIPIKAKNKENALKFAIFLTNKNNQLELAKLTSVLPVNKYALNDSYFQQTNSKEALARKISAEQISKSIQPIENKRSKKNIIILINSSLSKIMTGKANTKNELIQLDEKIKDFEDKF